MRRRSIPEEDPDDRRERIRCGVGCLIALQRSRIREGSRFGGDRYSPPRRYRRHVAADTHPRSAATAFSPGGAGRVPCTAALRRVCVTAGLPLPPLASRTSDAGPAVRRVAGVLPGRPAGLAADADRPGSADADGGPEVSPSAAAAGTHAVSDPTPRKKANAPIRPTDPPCVITTPQPPSTIGLGA